MASQIKAIDKSSVHRITSGQVVIDLQTAVKELIENSLDAGSTNIEIRFKNYGLKSLEVTDNGSGISEIDFESIALKHHTSKLETFEDLTAVQTFGFRGEALSSLCSLCEKVSVTTATKESSPKGTCLQMQKTGEVESREIVARKQGTTVCVVGLFVPLPVRRKELERNAKREFNKALNLLHSYALGPCASNAGVRMSVSNFSDKGAKTMQLQTQGVPSIKAAAKALWGSKAVENVVDLNLTFQVALEKSVVQRLRMQDEHFPESMSVQVTGLISKFAVGCGRLNVDRQFFYINGRPCNLSKIQKVFNEVYRTFSANQSPLIIADFTIPTNSCDVNVSPDKRTILLHNESNLILALKEALETQYSPSRSTFDLSSQSMTQTTLTATVVTQRRSEPAVHPAVVDDGDEPQPPALDTSTPIDSSSSSRALSKTPSEADSDIVFDTTKSIWSQPLPQKSLDSIQSVQPQAVPLAAEPVSSSRPHSRPQLERKNDKGPKNQVDPAPDPPSTPAGNRKTPLSSPTTVTFPSITQMPSDSTASLQLPATPASSSIHIHTSRKRRVGSAIENRDHNAPEHRPQKKMRVIGGLGTQLDSYAMQGRQSMTNKDDDGDGEIQSAEDSSDQESPQRHLRRQEDDNEDFDTDESSSILTSARQTISVSASSQVFEPSRPEVVKLSGPSAGILVHFDLEKVITLWRNLYSSTEPGTVNMLEDGVAGVPSEASVLNADNEKAADALSRVIDKADFASMNIIGQFNLGFIICRRRGLGKQALKAMDDLFIVDQHAADEKFNFENLQLTTKIQSQKLLRPRAIELTAADELVASENLQVLKDNGFEVETVAEGDAVGAGSRLRLAAQPVSKNTVFDMKDLEELIHLLRDSPSGTMVRCSKARAMFASRACRKSVMVGMPLNHIQMSTVVKHMGTMEQPWNCPHGRPTMRHLVDITTLGSTPLKVRPVSWECFS